MGEPRMEAENLGRTEGSPFSVGGAPTSAALPQSRAQSSSTSSGEQPQLAPFLLPPPRGVVLLFFVASFVSRPIKSILFSCFVLSSFLILILLSRRDSLTADQSVE